MKKLIIIIGLLVSITAAHVVLAQTSKSGVIVYEVKVNVHRRLPPDAEAMKARIPEYNIHQDQVAFNDQESFYCTMPDEEEEEFNDEGNGMRLRIMRPQVEYYFNQSQSKRVVLQDFMGKKILIEDSVKIIPWKLSNDTKVVLGYTCNKATYFNEETKQNVVAWYTDKIHLFVGPEGYNSLPGTVLQLDVNDGERIVTAKKIDLRALKKGEMKIPSGGQRMTEKEFRALAEEQMRRNGGRMIIRN
ncbi:GLPGLI family protein [Pseudochryseolinea flava]|nr:GLPGLI family protein [Pseudochryseolinea flava]